MTRKIKDSLEDGSKGSMSEHFNMRLLDLVTKQTIVGTSITFCGIGFLLTTAVGDVISSKSNMKYAYVMTEEIVYCARAGEGVMMMLLLYIGLSVNDAAY